MQGCGSEEDFARKRVTAGPLCSSMGRAPVSSGFHSSCSLDSLQRPTLRTAKAVHSPVSLHEDTKLQLSRLWNKIHLKGAAKCCTPQAAQGVSHSSTSRSQKDDCVQRQLSDFGKSRARATASCLDPVSMLLPGEVWTSQGRTIWNCSEGSNCSVISFEFLGFSH